jgi:hypothetical protein
MNQIDKVFLKFLDGPLFWPVVCTIAAFDGMILWQLMR